MKNIRRRTFTIQVKKVLHDLKSAFTLDEVVFLLSLSNAADEMTKSDTDPDIFC